MVVWGSSATVASGACTGAAGAPAAAASLSVVERPVRAAEAAFGVRVIAAATVPGVHDQRQVRDGRIG